MDQIREFLGNPIVGSVIGILGIVIGALLATVFYLKGKVVSKPYYTIETIKLIDLSVGEIPASVTMEYSGERIRCLNKTVIRFWNGGRKPIVLADLVPEYIEIPFGNDVQDDVKILNVNIEKSRDQTEISGPIIEEGKNIRFSFNFLEKGDNVCVTVLHTAKNSPVKIEGHVVGVPDGLVNVTEAQREAKEMLISAIFGTYGDFVSGVVNVLTRFLSHLA